MGEKHSDISKEEAGKITSETRVYAIWKDPVISKLIANWIWYIVPVVATIVFSYFKKEIIFNWLESILFLYIKIYQLLIIGFVWLITKYFYFKFFQKQKKQKDYFRAKFIGNYRFGDLNNVLLTTYITLPNNLQNTTDFKELDLLTCFRMFISYFNTGVSFNDASQNGDFLYYNLGPRLMSYGLCEKVPSLDNNTEGNINTYEIQTSENGYKFFALLESLDRVLNVKIYQAEVLENQKIIDARNGK